MDSKSQFLISLGLQNGVGNTTNSSEQYNGSAHSLQNFRSSSLAGFTLSEMVDSNYKDQKNEILEAHCSKTSFNVLRDAKTSKKSYAPVFKQMRKLRSYSWPKRHLRSMSAEANFEFINRFSIQKLKPCSTVLVKLSDAQINSLKILLKTTLKNQVLEEPLPIKLRRQTISRKSSCPSSILEVSEQEVVELKPMRILIKKLSNDDVTMIQNLLMSTDYDSKLIVDLVLKTRAMKIAVELLPFPEDEDTFERMSEASVLGFEDEEVNNNECDHCLKTKHFVESDKLMEIFLQRSDVNQIPTSKLSLQGSGRENRARSQENSKSEFISPKVFKTKKRSSSRKCKSQ